MAILKFIFFETKDSLGPATTQNLVVKFDGEICGGVLVENASDDFPQQMKLENILPNFAGSSPPISPKTSPTSLWKSLVLKNVSTVKFAISKFYCHGVSHEKKTAFWTILLFAPKAPPLKNRKFYFYCRLAVSE